MPRARLGHGNGIGRREGILQGVVVNEVKVDAETRKWSLVALERMLALP